MELLSSSEKRRLLKELRSLKGQFGPVPLTNLTLSALEPKDYDVLAVANLIYDPNGHIVLVRRVETPDEWVIPSGVVDPGEHILDTVARESKEETGLDVKVSSIVRIGLAPEFSPPAFRAVNRSRFGKESIGLLFVNFVSTGVGIPDCSKDPSKNILEVRAFAKVPFDLITHVYKVIFVQQGLFSADLAAYPPVEFSPSQPIWVGGNRNH
jgi:8-oxo-dGTP pyrophosphatase MutT (NUDIX family)